MATLDVQVTPPPGLAPVVDVVGAGFSTVTSSSTAFTVAPGTYTVAAETAMTSDPVVGLGFLGLISGSPASLVAGQTATVSVSYAPLGGSGYLWVPSWADGNIYGYRAASLHADGGGLSPALKLITDGGGPAQAVAMDRQGMLWAALFTYSKPNGTATSTDQLWGWRLLADGGAGAPTVINLTTASGGPVSAQSITFAANGDLWVVDGNDNRLLRYPRSALGANGAITPSATISNNGLSAPYGIAFDARGNGWVVNNTTVEEFPSDGDGGLGSVPLAILDGGLFTYGNGITFDSHGDLWVVGFSDNHIVRFNPASVTGSGPLSAAAVLVDNTDAGYIAQPEYVDFDESGNLWLINKGPLSLVKIDNPASLTGTVQVAPSAVFNPSGLGAIDTAKFQFNPPAPGLGQYP